MGALSLDEYRCNTYSASTYRPWFALYGRFLGKKRNEEEEVGVWHWAQGFSLCKLAVEQNRQKEDDMMVGHWSTTRHLRGAMGCLDEGGDDVDKEEGEEEVVWQWAEGFS
ncbi:hypothetical protein DUNSADRAFT_7566 [Dunaliella salina]|uniref:Encoded protein n=1 Tax=Dunaliella salina TaxID=3046 RepID=A0ABQ7GL45_DUNSA|nr:hypothetical protein DUNSADRAFT_7566 [Dunaliella salina]|eukprot:KAF5835334.1 hypothetical protein DUNSADRAFT_7566 [Dunaliella salina]